MSQDVSVASERFVFPSINGLRQFMLRVLKGAMITWLCAGLFIYQASRFDTHTSFSHPVETLIHQAALAVDATSITVVSGLLGTPPAEDLSFLKNLSSGVTDALHSLSDVPDHWELIADAHDGYRSVRYEGRGPGGTHWVISAYQLDQNDTVYVSLRTEQRDVPEDLRFASYQLRQLLHAGVGQPLKHVETRIAVSGRTRGSQGVRSRDFAEELLASVGWGEAVRVREDATALWAAGYSPFLTRTDSGPTNIELHMVPEGDGTRLTVGTPHLGGIEISLASGRPYAHTSLSYGQTMAKEVR